MKWIPEDNAKAILEPHFPNFLFAMRQAQEDWKDVAARYPDQTPRSRANFINDQIRKYVRERYDSGKIKEPGGAFFLLIHGLAARFRRLRGGRPSNIPTDQALLFQAGQLILGDHLDGPMIVNVGYDADKAFAKFRYMVTLAKKTRVVWEIDFTDQIEGGAAVEIPESDVPPAPTVTRRVQKKKAQ